MQENISNEKPKTSDKIPPYSASQNILESLARAIKNGEEIELVPFRKWQNLRLTKISKENYSL